MARKRTKGKASPAPLTTRAPSPPPAPAREVVPEPAPTPRPAKEAAAAEPIRAVTAYLVLVETEHGPRSYALVAGDIATAAAEASERVAAKHPGAAIRSIQRVAELFPG